MASVNSFRGIPAARQPAPIQFSAPRRWLTLMRPFTNKAPHRTWQSFLRCFENRSALAITLVCLLGLETPVLQAQQEPQVAPPSLKIAVLTGDAANNNIRKQVAVEPSVLVTDEKGDPVSGVMVVFTLPETGAGGIFPNGSKTSIVYTSIDGRAVARGLKPNSTPGEFQIVVDASFHGLTARTTLRQTNILSEPARGVSSKLIAILAIAGGAAAAGAIAAGGGGSSNPSTPPPTRSATITAGTPTFAPPQ
jgi:hypothetical protein